MSSLILQQFSELIKDTEVLNKHEEFLGPNYKEVLDFWNKIENMSEEQLKVVDKCNWAFFVENFSEWVKVTDLANAASYEVVGSDYAHRASWAAYRVTKSNAVCFATREILGNVENPVFLQMFDNL